MQSLYHCMLYDITTSCMKVIILFEIDLNIRDRNSQITIRAEEIRTAM